MILQKLAAGLAGVLLLASCGTVASIGVSNTAGAGGTAVHPTGATRGAPAVADDAGLLHVSSGDIACRFPDTDVARRLADRIISSEPRVVAAGPGAVAFAVHDDQTGTTCSRNGEQPFVAASTIKVSTVAARLWQAETQGFELPEEERFWAELAITVSDNDAQEYLWAVVGGANAIAEFFAAAGMAHTIPSFADDDWGLTAITADDQLILVRHLVEGTLLNRADSDFLLDLMRQVSPEQVWGVDSGAPAEAVVALKNGWLDDTFKPFELWVDADLAWTNNSIGHIAAPGASYSLVVLSTGHATEEAGREVVGEVARTVADAVLGR